MRSVRVNRDYCAGTGLCATICPDVFEVRDGYSFVLVAEIPAERAAKVAEAVTLCPTSALELVTAEAS